MVVLCKRVHDVPRALQKIKQNKVLLHIFYWWFFRNKTFIDGLFTCKRVFYNKAETRTMR